MFKNKKLIVAISILIPLVVAVLLGSREPIIRGYDLSFLPPVYATINGITACVLLLAWSFIKRGNKVLHERMIYVAFSLSIVFLLMYVAYHITTPRTEHPKDSLYIPYLIVLFSHILLSVAVIPLALFAVFYAKTANFVKHRKIVRWSFPVWLYVAVSGVIVYLMISPYYKVILN